MFDDEDDEEEVRRLEEEIAASERIAHHVEGKKLHELLECTLDPLESEEFGGGVCLYHAYICIIAYEKDSCLGQLAFDVLHPADDRERCQLGVPAGFSVPWDFDPLLTSKLVRRLAASANKEYDKIGIRSEMVGNVHDLELEIMDEP